MTDAGQPRLGGHDAQGKPGAIAAWALYLLSLPSANILVIVGLVVAYAVRDQATGVPRQHIEAQIALFWSVFWWTIGLWLMLIVCAITVILLPIAILAGLALFVLTIWFTVKSLLGLLNLLSDRAP